MTSLTNIRTERIYLGLRKIFDQDIKMETVYPSKIDLHMHSTVSDGTDTPEEILQNVKKADIKLFSLTDHDAIKGCIIIRGLLKEGDPCFIPGVEFSCSDDKGKYHILGYGYDPEDGAIRGVVEKGHSLRMMKVNARLEFLKDAFGVVFPQEELDRLFAMENPGKPHIGNLMAKYGYAKDKNDAIKNYINKKKFKNVHVRPDEAIEGILKSGGTPVLAHPAYGDGDQLILGEELDERVGYLKGFGLKGVEAFYSGFTAKIREQVLTLASKYDLYVTAGSDYHGTNKMIKLAENDLPDSADYPEGLKRFLREVVMR